MKTMTQFLLFYVLIHACCCFFVFPHSFTTNTTLTTCLPHQTSILLQLKTDFGYDSPKMKHWNIEDGNGDCCFWDGVSCNLATGYVIGLDLSNSWLHGPFRSNSSLFRLLHLQKLNLAFNYFIECLIPSELGRLSRLSYLNLSSSDFSGQIPYEISRLKNLIVLDLSENFDLFVRPGEFGRLVNQNMTNLRQLNLSYTNISGNLPNSIGNLKSLNFLDLHGCGFSGFVPPSLSNLTQLSYLVLSSNYFNGQLPYALGNLENLTSIDLEGNNFSGQIPSSLGNFTKLEKLDLSNNFLDGKLPITFPHNINYIFLQKNNLTGSIPSSCIANLTILYYLDLSYNSLSGVIPSSLFNLPYLESLNLGYNQFIGSLNIHNISDSSKLMYLYLMRNKLTGDIPSSMLRNLLIDFNDLSGRLDFSMFSALSSLEALDLSENRELSITNLSTKFTLPKLRKLYLNSCNNITEFPMFLKMQTQLQYLDLSGNRIGGQIPKWLLSLELLYLNLSHNSITGWEKATLILPWDSLFSLDLHSNMLRGRLVVPPMSTWYFSASENSLSGSIDPLFCKLGNLQFLELSSNNLSGTIPRCLGNSATSSLLVLNLRRNNFHGKMPKICGNGSQLTTLDLSRNQLHGKIPKSLTACKDLQVLNLGHNQMSDSFPFWLQDSSNLRVLVLSSNKFYGPIWRPHNFLGFSNLKIIDLSFNDFTGSLPAQYFRNWTSMAENSDGNRYFGNDHGYQYYFWMSPFSPLGYISNDKEVLSSYYYSMTVTNKGQEMNFFRILTMFMCIDLSNNRFHGEIPTTIGGLGSLVVLNLSSNSFTGHIPSSMRSLTMLESLDLSNNKLSGEIPLQLSTALTFLGYLNLSNNQFVGQIPQGGQIGTFPNSSFLGNLGLCGRPLSKMCGTVSPTPSPNNDQNDTSRDDSIISGFTWKAVAVGYGCGVAIGVVGGHIIISRSPYLMWVIFRVRMQRRLRR